LFTVIVVLSLDGTPTLKSDPSPESVTVCGLPLAFELMVSEAVRVPVAFGLNVTETTQLAPGARVLPQLLVWSNSVAFVPMRVMVVMFSVSPPVFVSVTVWAALVVFSNCGAKVSAGGTSDTAGCDAIPVPVIGTDCGLSAASSVMTRDALLSPADTGEKATLIVQLTEGAGDRHRDVNFGSAFQDGD